MGSMVEGKFTGEVAIEEVGLGSAMNELFAQAVSANVVIARECFMRMVCGELGGAYPISIATWRGQNILQL
jgi:hypothetical protein